MGKKERFAFYLTPEKKARMGRVLSPKRGNSGPNPVSIRWEGQGLCPSRDRGTQRLTGGHAGLSRSRRSFATRWRSVASSNSANWLE